MKGSLAIAVSLLLAACGGHDAPPAPPHFSVHEWGLIAVQSGALDGVAMSGALEVTHGALRPEDVALPEPYGTLLHPTGAVGLKPVIYVHTEGAGAGEVDVSIRVRAPGGEMLEIVPRRSGAAGRDEAVWAHAHARQTSCATPTAQPTCQAPDGYCEAMEDRFYDAATASCLRFGEHDQRNHLLYRARVDAARLPLTVSWPYAGTMHVRNTSDVRVTAPAWLIDTGGAIRFDPPAPGAETEIPRAAARVPLETARAAVLETLRSQGLDDAEAHAFDVAWAHVLFDAPVPDEVAHLAVGRTPEVLTPSVVVLYLAPDEIASRVLPLDVTPRPTAVHRALFVRLAVSQDAPGSLELPSLGEGALGVRSGS